MGVLFSDGGSDHGGRDTRVRAGRPPGPRSRKAPAVAPVRACTTTPEAPCQGAAIATHYEVDFSEHYPAPYLAALGLGSLGWNTRYRGRGAWSSLEAALTDIGAGVAWLRQAGAETVVILGNSGGASLISAYQATRAGSPDAGDLSAGATDRLVGVPRTWADLQFVDQTLEPTDRPAGWYRGDPRRASYGSSGLAASTTLRAWLSPSRRWSSSRCGPGRLSERRPGPSTPAWPPPTAPSNWWPAITTFSSRSRASTAMLHVRR